MKYIILFFTLLFSTYSFSQRPDSITVTKVFGGYKYQQAGQNLTMKMLKNRVKSNEEAYKLMESAKTNYDVAVVFGALGGGLIGWPLGQAIGGGDPDWVLAGIGAGLIVISIPFGTKANRNSKSAVDLFNSGWGYTGFLSKAEWRFGTTSNGIGIRMIF